MIAGGESEFAVIQRESAAHLLLYTQCCWRREVHPAAAMQRVLGDIRNLLLGQTYFLLVMGMVVN